MKKEHVLLTVLLISFLATNIGAFLTITHRPFGREWLLVGLAGSLAYWFTALNDVLRARRLPIPERLMWVIGLLAVPYVTGWFYFFACQRGRVSR